MSEKHIKKSGGGLRKRWLRSSVFTVIITLVVVVLAFSLFIYSNYYSTVKTGLESKAKTATDFFSNYVANTSAEYYIYASRYTESFDDSHKLELQFIDYDGRVMFSTFGISAGSSPNTPDILQTISRGQISTWVGKDPSTGERIMSVSAPVMYPENQVVGVMRYVTSMRLVDRQIAVSILAVFALGAVIILFVVFINLVFIRSVIEPVSEITKMSKRIAQGSYGIQIKKNYRDEIGEMVDSINEMSLKIAQSEKVQTEFISSISHELRTPLTAITGWGETLIYNENLDSETKKGMVIILKEARRLTKMVEELLEFTRMEDGRFTLNIELIDIIAELEDSIFTYRELMNQDDMELVYEPYEKEMPLIPGDPSRLKQVFLNIFSNAAKYGREGKRVEVSVNMDNSYVYISTRDFGQGVPEDELDHIKMKFYKGSNAKERGSGIGLAVCDEIIRFHGGELILENAAGGGLRVTIKLPVSSSI